MHQPLHDPQDIPLDPSAPSQEEPTPPPELVEGVSRAVAEYVRNLPGAGARIDVGREVTHVLRQTADHLESLQETQERLLAMVGDPARQESQLQATRSLNLAFRSLTETQLELAQELRRERSRGRVWLITALIAVALLVVGGLTLGNLGELRELVSEDREELSTQRQQLDATLAQVRQELREGDRSLHDGLDAMRSFREELYQDQEQQHLGEVARLRQELDQKILEGETRLAELRHTNDRLTASQEALSDSLEEVGKRMELLRTENQALRLERDEGLGRLRALEQQIDGRYPLSRGEVEILGPEDPPDPDPQSPPGASSPGSGERASRAATSMLATEAPPPPGPESGASPTPLGGSPTPPPAPADTSPAVAPTAPPPPAGEVTVPPLLARFAREKGLVVVGATPGTAPGTYRDLIFESQSQGRPSRRYTGHQGTLFIDETRGQVVLLIDQGALTVFGLRGGKPFESSIEVKDFRLLLAPASLPEWRDSGIQRRGTPR